MQATNLKEPRTVDGRPLQLRCVLFSRADIVQGAAGGKSEPRTSAIT